MLKVSHATLVWISGLVWMAVGCFLLPLGLKLLIGSAQNELGLSLPLLGSLASYVGGLEEAALVMTTIALFIGYIKGKHVLGKSAKRSIARILTFSNPTTLANIYSRAYYILLGSMIVLGMSIKWLGLSDDIRGVVDIAVGAALINGALIYFRSALNMQPVAVKQH